MPRSAHRCVPVNPTAAMLRALLLEHSATEGEVALSLQAWTDTLARLRSQGLSFPAPSGWQWVPLCLDASAVNALLLQHPDAQPCERDVAWAHRAWSRTVKAAPAPVLRTR